MKGIVVALARGALMLAIAPGCSGDIDSGSHIDAAPGSGIDGEIPGGVGEPANLTGITLYHNQVRAAVDTSGVAAGPLPPMVWDDAIAAHALAYTQMCVDTEAPAGLVDHSSLGYRSNAAGFPYVGENVFGSGGPATPKGAVDAWAAEKANFTYPSSCAGSCGHYTQVVWRESTHLGCANVTCAGLAYGGTILCMYGPGGNSGSTPY
jgi:uncharacterized protein YkwD